jgi:hypothetical protein
VVKPPHNNSDSEVLPVLVSASDNDSDINDPSVIAPLLLPVITDANDSDSEILPVLVSASDRDSISASEYDSADEADSESESESYSEIENESDNKSDSDSESNSNSSSSPLDLFTVPYSGATVAVCAVAALRPRPTFLHSAITCTPRP